jgi:outer membrane protein
MRFNTALSLLFLLNIICFRVAAQAPERWTWEDCISYALDNNLQLKQVEINNSLAKLQLKQHQLSMTPNVNAAFDNSYSFGRSLDPTTYSFVLNEVTITNRIQLGLQQPLFEGLKNLHNIRKSKSDLVVLALETQALREDLQLNILTAYLNILNAEEQLSQAIEHRARTTEQAATTKIFIEAGALAEANLNDIEAQETADDLYISQIKYQRDIAYQMMIALLQLEPGREIQIEPISAEDISISSYPMPALMEVYETALGTQPRVNSARQRVKSYQHSIKAAKGNYYPSLSFFSTVYTNQSNRLLNPDGTFSVRTIGALQSDLSELVVSLAPNFAKASFIDQMGDNLSYALGLSLNIPIYNKRLAWLNVQQTKINLESSQLEQKQQELTLYNDVHQAWLKAQAAIENYSAAIRAYEAAKKSRDFAEDRYKAGSINSLQLNLANSNVSSAQSRLTQAKYEFLFNTRVLDHYLGKPIQF